MYGFVSYLLVVCDPSAAFQYPLSAGVARVCPSNPTRMALTWLTGFPLSLAAMWSRFSLTVAILVSAFTLAPPQISFCGTMEDLYLYKAVRVS